MPTSEFHQPETRVGEPPVPPAASLFQVLEVRHILDPVDPLAEVQGAVERDKPGLAVRPPGQVVVAGVQVDPRAPVALLVEQQKVDVAAHTVCLVRGAEEGVHQADEVRRLRLPSGSQRRGELLDRGKGVALRWTTDGGAESGGGGTVRDQFARTERRERSPIGCISTSDSQRLAANTGCPPSGSSNDSIWSASIAVTIRAIDRIKRLVVWRVKGSGRTGRANVFLGSLPSSSHPGKQRHGTLRLATAGVERAGDDGGVTSPLGLAEPTGLDQLLGLGATEAGVKRLRLHDAARRGQERLLRTLKEFQTLLPADDSGLSVRLIETEPQHVRGREEKVVEDFGGEPPLVVGQVRHYFQKAMRCG